MEPTHRSCAGASGASAASPYGEHSPWPSTAQSTVHASHIAHCMICM